LYEKSTGERSNFYEWILLAKATSLYHLERVEESEAILMELQSLYNTTNIESTQVKTLLGQVYYKKGSKLLGKQTINRAIEDAVSLNIGSETETNARYALAKIEYLEGNHSLALEYLDNILDLHAKQNSPLTDPNIYSLKAKVLEANKEFEESLIYFRKYHALIDKVRMVN
jgi:tetratricopeptide (TPR) repeat protein